MDIKKEQGMPADLNEAREKRQAKAKAQPQSKVKTPAQLAECEATVKRLAQEIIENNPSNAAIDNAIQQISEKLGFPVGAIRSDLQRHQKSVPEKPLRTSMRSFLNASASLRTSSSAGKIYFECSQN